MKACSKCGYVFKDDRLSCPRCGGTPVDMNSGGSYAYGYSYGNKGMNRNSAFDSQQFAKKNGYQGGSANQKAGKKKGRGKSKLVFGIICIVCGLSCFSGISQMSTEEAGGIALEGLVLLVLGIVLTCMYISQSSWCTKLEPLIDNRGNTRISYIASSLQMDEAKVRKKLQKLINKGFLSEPELGIGAYINGEYGLVVMTRNGQPIVPIEKTMATEFEAKRQREENMRESMRFDSYTVEQKFHMLVEDSEKLMKDEEVVNYLKSMDKSISNIKRLVDESPEEADNKNVQNMRSKYIPSTIELIEKYARRTTSADTRNEIKGMFSTLSKAFANIEKQLVEKDDMDTEIDIEVMRQTLAREGLLDSDFDLDK